jgi:hypothetical protein
VWALGCLAQDLCTFDHDIKEHQGYKDRSDELNLLIKRLKTINLEDRPTIYQLLQYDGFLKKHVQIFIDSYFPLATDMAKMQLIHSFKYSFKNDEYNELLEKHDA